MTKFSIILGTVFCLLEMSFHSDAFGDRGVVGPDARVVLAYQHRDHIIFRECRQYAPLSKETEWKKVCGHKHGMVELTVPAVVLKKSLQLALRVPADYDSELQRKIALYNDNNSGTTQEEIQSLSQKREIVSSLIHERQQFINLFDPETAKAEDVAELPGLRDRLNELTRALALLTNREYYEAITQEIEDKLDKLISDISDSARLELSVYSTDRTSFEFNLLRVFTRDPVLPFQFVKFRAGTFTMGSPEEAVPVEIQRDFEMARKETTQLQYFLMTGENPSVIKEPRNCVGRHLSIDGVQMCPGLPVGNVSWNDIHRPNGFLAKINDFFEPYFRSLGCQGSTPYPNPADTAGCLRLPTESEWEYAARGAGQFKEEYPVPVRYLHQFVNYGFVDGYGSNPEALHVRPLYGLRHMLGNVWEWTYHNYTYVARGGDTASLVEEVRLSSRRPITNSSRRRGDTGFRLVRQLERD